MLAGLGRRSPFLWLVLTPLLTAPLSLVLIFGFAEALDARSLGLPTTRMEANLQATLYYYDFWPTWLLLTIAGLPNLLVALWFLHRSGYVGWQRGRRSWWPCFGPSSCCWCSSPPPRRM